MPGSRPGPTRGQWRVWLTWVLQSGLLEKLPPRYEPDGPGDPRTPGDVARRLLTALQDPELSRPAQTVLMNEAEAFRSWVDGRLKANRQLLLAERAAGDADRGWLERWAGAERRLREHAAPPKPAPVVRPRWDPMWDAELDG